jgi:repressor LexA
VALTRRQREIFDFIREFVDEKGYSPSLKEIGEGFGISSVEAWNRSRSVEPIEEPARGSVALPLAGVVAAGAPIEAIEDVETIEVPLELVPHRGRSFALRVRGDSMIGEHIRDGDTVIVEGRSEARNGDTVVALIRGSDATLKKFYRKGSRVRLEPANPAMDPIEVPARDVEIRGVVRGLVRRY